MDVFDRNGLFAKNTTSGITLQKNKKKLWDFVNLKKLTNRKIKKSSGI